VKHLSPETELAMVLSLIPAVLIALGLVLFWG
jgi:hypothetical protein